MFLIVTDIISHRRLIRRGSMDALELTLRPWLTAAGHFDPTAVEQLAVEMYPHDQRSLEAAQAEFAEDTTVLVLVSLHRGRYAIPTDRVTFMPGGEPILRVDGPLGQEVLDVVERVRKERHVEVSDD